MARLDPLQRVYQGQAGTGAAVIYDTDKDASKRLYDVADKISEAAKLKAKKPVGKGKLMDLTPTWDVYQNTATDLVNAFNEGAASLIAQGQDIDQNPLAQQKKNEVIGLLSNMGQMKDLYEQSTKQVSQMYKEGKLDEDTYVGWVEQANSWKDLGKSGLDGLQQQMDSIDALNLPQPQEEREPIDFAKIFNQDLSNIGYYEGTEYGDEIDPITGKLKGKDVKYARAESPKSIANIRVNTLDDLGKAEMAIALGVDPAANVDELKKAYEEHLIINSDMKIDDAYQAVEKDNKIGGKGKEEAKVILSDWVYRVLVDGNLNDAVFIQDMPVPGAPSYTFGGVKKIDPKISRAKMEGYYAASLVALGSDPKVSYTYLADKTAEEYAQIIRQIPTAEADAMYNNMINSPFWEEVRGKKLSDVPLLEYQQVTKGSQSQKKGDKSSTVYVSQELETPYYISILTTPNEQLEKLGIAQSKKLNKLPGEGMARKEGGGITGAPTAPTPPPTQSKKTIKGF